MSTQDTTLPPLPDFVAVAIGAYGDERADDSPTALNHYREALAAVREWGAAIAAQAQQAQVVPAPDLIAAAQAVVRAALDAVEVHPCDANDDSVRAKFLIGPMAELHSALAAAPQAEPALDKTLDHLSTMIGLVLGARQRGAAYEAGSAIDKAVQEAIEHLKDWPQAPAASAEPQPSAPAPEPSEERRQLLHLLDDIVEEAEQDGATYYRIRDGKDILFSNMVGACARLLAQPEAPAVEAEPPPEREPLTDEQIRGIFLMDSNVDFDDTVKQAYAAGIHAAEQAHGIGAKGGDKP